jgi:hypothetical protein
VIAKIYFFFCFYLLFRAGTGHPEKTFAEDGPLEWLQVIFLIMGAACALAAFAFHRKWGRWKAIPLLFCFFLLFVALEEISYGQRIFRFQSPYFFLRENAHREVNVHNLPWFDSASEAASAAILVLWGIILPAVLHFRRDWATFLERLSFPVPGPAVMLGCLGGLLLEIYYRHRFPFYWADSNEILELFLYVGFFGASLSLLRQSRQKDA